MSPKEEKKEIIPVTKTTKRTIKKHSAMVHISGKPNLIQRKMWNVMFGYVEKDFLTQQVFEMKISDLCSDIGFESNRDDAYIKSNLKSLKNITVEWNLLEKGKTKPWGSYSLISAIEFNVKPGYVRFEFPQMLKERWLESKKMFAVFNTKMMNSLKRQYSLILYELAYDYKGATETPWLKLDMFKKLMGIEDLPRYEKFKFINSEIIKKSVDEVNEKTNLRVSVEFKKEKRVVKELKFHIVEVVDDKANMKKTQLSLFDENDNPLDLHKDLVDKLLKLKFGLPEIKKHNEDHGAKKLKDHVEYLEMQVNIKSPKKFLIKSLVEDYDLTELYEQRTKEKKREDEKKQQQESREKEQRQREETEKIEGEIEKWIEANKEEFKKMVEECDLPTMKKIGSQYAFVQKKAREKKEGEVDYMMKSRVLSAKARSKVWERIKPKK